VLDICIIKVLYFIVWRVFIWIMVGKLYIYWTQYTDSGLLTFV